MKGHQPPRISKRGKIFSMAILCAGIICVSQSLVHADCKVEETNVLWLPGWILENDLIRVEVYNPGAMVRNIFIKKSGNGMLHDFRFPEGPLHDCIPNKDFGEEPTCPSHGLAKTLDWDGEILENTKEKVKVKFSVVLDYNPTWEQDTDSKVPYEGRDKLKVTRIDTILSGSPVYKREYIIENIGNSDALFWYNICSLPAVGGETKNDRIFASTERKRGEVGVSGAGNFSYYRLTPSQPFIAMWDSQSKEALVYLGPLKSAWPDKEPWFKYVHFWGSLEGNYNIEPSPTMGVDESLKAMLKNGKVLKKGEKWHYFFYIMALSDIEDASTIKKSVEKFIDRETVGKG